MNQYDVIIVGAGPAGYFCAYELMEKDPSLKVLLLEKGYDINSRKCPILSRKLTKCPVNKEKVLCITLFYIVFFLITLLTHILLIINCIY